MDLEALCVGLSRQDQPLARNTQVIKHGKAFVIVLGILQNPQGDLLDVAEAGYLPGLFSGPGKDREEDSCQYGDDGDHHQQLNQGETAFRGHFDHIL